MARKVAGESVDVDHVVPGMRGIEGNKLRIRVRRARAAPFRSVDVDIYVNDGQTEAERRVQGISGFGEGRSAGDFIAGRVPNGA